MIDPDTRSSGAGAAMGLFSILFVAAAAAWSIGQAEAAESGSGSPLPDNAVIQEVNFDEMDPTQIHGYELPTGDLIVVTCLSNVRAYLAYSAENELRGIAVEDFMSC